MEVDTILLKNNCAICQKCCVNNTEKDFEIRLTDKERRIYKKKVILIKAKEKCPYLDNGCKLKIRPFICRLYPLIYRDKKIYQDENCPCRLEYNLRASCYKVLLEVNKMNEKELERISDQYRKSYKE